MLLRIANLAGVYTGAGFVEKEGRRPTTEDCGFLAGPIDIICSDETGLICQIGRNGSSPPGHEAKEIDGRGLIATSGFIDSHTHALYAGERSSEHFRRWAGASYREIAEQGGGIHRTVRETIACSDACLAQSLRDRVAQMLSGGTTVVEVKSGYAGSPEGELRLLRLIKNVASQTMFPELRATFLGLHALPSGCQENEYCTSMIEALPIAKSEGLAQHVDVFPEQGFFSLGESLRFAQAAQEFGFAVKVHADQLSDSGSARAFAENGALSVDHLECISLDSIDILAGSCTVATLLPGASLFLKSAYPPARKLIDCGVRVALATDCNPGSAPAMNFQLVHLLAACQMRMNAAEILCACTYNGAAALGLARSHGVITEGCVANLALWPCEATGEGRSMVHMERIFSERLRPSCVIIRGRVYARDERRGNGL